LKVNKIKNEKTSFNLPVGLRDAFKLLATQRKVQMQDVIADLIRGWVDGTNKSASAEDILFEIQEEFGFVIGDSRISDIADWVANDLTPRLVVARSVLATSRFKPSAPDYLDDEDAATVNALVELLREGDEDDKSLARLTIASWEKRRYLARPQPAEPELPEEEVRMIGILRTSDETKKNAITSFLEILTQGTDRDIEMAMLGVDAWNRIKKPVPQTQRAVASDSVLIARNKRLNE
jgi:hypothetical protein